MKEYKVIIKISNKIQGNFNKFPSIVGHPMNCERRGDTANANEAKIYMVHAE